MPVKLSETPPAGYRLSSDQALERAAVLREVRDVLATHRRAAPYVYLLGHERWQVDWQLPSGRLLAEVVLSGGSGRVLERWSGIQAEWTMARGTPGAFGELADSVYVWLPLCLLFLAPFVNWRRPLSLLHLDLLALLSFCLSFAFFEHGVISLSVPLSYPPLIYLLARMLTLALKRPSIGAQPLQLRLRTRWLAIGVVVIATFRIALNVTDGNVIDVGYAGVVGAARILHGERMYGGYPSLVEHGDTYGPFNYEAYVPFEVVFGWSGTWDSLPAAHAASIAFDLLALLCIFLIGLRIRGPTLGVALAWAWVTYPFTLIALNSDSNDALLAAMVLAALLAASSPPRRGALTALAGLTKIAPFALAPLLASDLLARARSTSHRLKALAGFALGFAIAAAASFAPALAHDSLGFIWRRTVIYQSTRTAPFSLWGLYHLSSAKLVIEGFAAALALALAVLPRRPGIPALAAACAAVIIALQLGLEYWFYLYIPWFFPLVAIALLAGLQARSPPTSRRCEDAHGAKGSSATSPLSESAVAGAA